MSKDREKEKERQGKKRKDEREEREGEKGRRERENNVINTIFMACTSNFKNTFAKGINYVNILCRYICLTRCADIVQAQTENGEKNTCLSATCFRRLSDGSLSNILRKSIYITNKFTVKVFQNLRTRHSTGLTSAIRYSHGLLGKSKFVHSHSEIKPQGCKCTTSFLHITNLRCRNDSLGFFGS